MKVTPEAEATREQARRDLREVVLLRRRHERGLVTVNGRLEDLLVDLHGNPADGRLTYRELAEIVGLSRNRIIQLIKGES